VEIWLQPLDQVYEHRQPTGFFYFEEGWKQFVSFRAVHQGGQVNGALAAKIIGNIAEQLGKGAFVFRRELISQQKIARNFDIGKLPVYLEHLSEGIPNFECIQGFVDAGQCCRIHRFEPDVDIGVKG